MDSGKKTRKGLTGPRRLLAVLLASMCLFGGAALPAQAIDVVDHANQCNVNGYWQKICTQRVFGVCVSTKTYWYQCQISGKWYGGSHLPKIVL